MRRQRRIMRSRWLASAVAAALMAGVGLWWWTRTPAFSVRPDTGRNILLITIDTLRADALGSYGGRALTPRLDGLAGAGARFDFAHAHAVVTLPSHASILTGRYPYEHGVRDNTGYRLAPGAQTAATRLERHGFATGAFVGGFPLDRRFGLSTGFDVYDDRLDAGPGEEMGGERERRADAVVGSALEWIGSQPGKWFAWVHLYDPHVRYEPPADWAARFPADPYLAEVSWTDAALAPLLDELSTLASPTLVIVTADHGEGLGDHGELTHGVFAYESVLRVPLIVSQLGSNQSPPPNPVVISAPARHVDLVPTLLDAAGIEADASLAGTSLLRVINRNQQADRPSYFEAMTPTITRGWAPLRGVIAGREKYIDLPVPELYDLADDPREANNLAASRGERARVLSHTLAGFDAAPPGQPMRESTETLARLRSLGYVGGGAAPARESYSEEDDPKKLIEIDRWMTHAAEAHQQGRLDEAADIYQRVIDRRPDTEDAYRKLALVYWRSGRPRLAIQTLETALRNGVVQSEVRIKLGEYLARAGDTRRAIELLDVPAEDDPDALLALGNAYHLAGRGPDAVRTFERVLALQPDNALAYENLGVAYLERHDHDSAERALRRATTLDPRLSGAWTALGVLLATTGRRGDAIAAWTRAVEAEPANLDALFNLTVSLAGAGRTEEARVYGRRYLERASPAHQRDALTIRRLLAR
jgi:arylsulfatase A-like enzyme/Flp pilus assembly protein TadD